MATDVHFYIPENKLKAHWPSRLDDDWSNFSGGANVWTYFTYVALCEFGYPVQLSTRVPEQGIILSHARFLPQRRLATADSLVVCLRADYGRNHHADLHVVQNPMQTGYPGLESLERIFLPGPSHFISHWPQPGLQARNPARGSGIVNVAYIGAERNLHPAFKSAAWLKALEHLGCRFLMLSEPATWHDYSELDLILAVRPLDIDPLIRKPHSKLVNAWLAGTPALLGNEPAYRAVGRPATDYVEVDTPEQALQAIQRLQAMPGEYMALVEKGRQAAAPFTFEAIARDWWTFIETVARPMLAQKRRQSPLERLLRARLRDCRSLFSLKSDD